MDHPLVSVIVPVYNVEPYIEDAIKSLLNQTIGFRANVQVLLVDDGSTDGSAGVCQRYAGRYPLNIQYVAQHNAGVSKARNTGFALAKGEYIHFLDGDDLLPKNFYKATIKFLRKHQDEIDFVATKLKFFDAAIDSHPLNDKFKKSRVIDLEIEPDNPILHVISCVFRADSIRNVHFDEKLSVSEDVKYLSDVLLKNKKYGVVSTSAYYYRKRSTTTSAIGGKEKNKSYYLDTPVRAYEYLATTWHDTPGFQFIDYTLLYDISYRLEQKTENVLTPSERLIYKETLQNILRTLSDEAVVSHRFLSIYKKMYILRLKYGEKLREFLTQKDEKVYFRDMLIYDRRSLTAHLDFIERHGETYKVEGYIEGYMPELAKARVSVNGEQYEVVRVPRAQREGSFLGDVYDDGNAFESTIKLQPGMSIKIEVDGNILPVKTRPFTRLASYRYAYRRDATHLINKSPQSITIHNYSRLLHLVLELRQLLLISTRWKLDVFKERFRQMRTRNFSQLSWKARVLEAAKPSLFTIETVCLIPRAFALRAAYYFGRSLQRRPIWIISDRGMAAGDNGEALFRYIMAQDDCPADVYFALSRRSKDYDRMHELGPVLNYGSMRHKLKFLLADKVISSHADIEVTNPFNRQIDHFVDLCNFDFVFLQHGIIRNDLSNWLNRFEKNISLFITSARREYDSIFQHPYYYTNENLLLSGLPRYDYLENNPQNKLVVAPTYRNSLLRYGTDKYGARAYDDRFKNSEYFQFYNRLINDSEVLSAMNKAGMSGELYVHPNFAAQTSDFKGNDTFTVKAYPYDYKKAISEGSLLVSDYSSIVFDFAYLGKPIIYSLFDVDTFYALQPYDKGEFFHEESDGFGPTTHTYDQLVRQIVTYIERRNQIEQQYVKRAKEFFAYSDKKNSERVYRALCR